MIYWSDDLIWIIPADPDEVAHDAPGRLTVCPVQVSRHVVSLTLLSPGETVPHNCTVTGNTGQHNDCHTWTWGMSSCQVGSIKHAHINTWCLIFLILTSATCYDVSTSLMHHVMMSHPHPCNMSWYLIVTSATCHDVSSSPVQHVIMSCPHWHWWCNMSWCGSSHRLHY